MSGLAVLIFTVLFVFFARLLLLYFNAALLFGERGKVITPKVADCFLLGYLLLPSLS